MFHVEKQPNIKECAVCLKWRHFLHFLASSAGRFFATFSAFSAAYGTCKGGGGVETPLPNIWGQTPPRHPDSQQGAPQHVHQHRRASHGSLWGGGVTCMQSRAAGMPSRYCTAGAYGGCRKWAVQTQQGVWLRGGQAVTHREGRWGVVSTRVSQKVWCVPVLIQLIHLQSRERRNKKG